MIKTVEIPAKFYEFGMPYQTDYINEKDKGLAYYISSEQRFEILTETGENANVMVVSLLSPYILGFEFGYSASELEVVSVDIPNRKLTIKTKAQ